MFSGLFTACIMYNVYMSVYNMYTRLVCCEWYGNVCLLEKVYFLRIISFWEILMSYGVWSAHALAWTISSLEVPTLSLSKSVLFQINKTYILAVPCTILNTLNLISILKYSQMLKPSWLNNLLLFYNG